MALVRTQEGRGQVLSSPPRSPGPCARTQAVGVNLFPLRWGQVLLQLPLARWQGKLLLPAQSVWWKCKPAGAEGSHKSIYSSVKVLSSPCWL